MYSESLKTSAEEIPNEKSEAEIFPDNRERFENMEAQPQTVEPKNEIETFARKTDDARETFERIQTEQGELAKVRANLGIEGGDTSGMDTRMKDAFDAIVEAENVKRGWRESHSDEEFPEGLAVSLDERGENWEEKMALPESARQDAEAIKKMESKERRAIIEEWKAATLNDFTSFLETNSGTADAVNLSMVQKLLRFNLPVVIENAGKKFVEGKSDELPVCVWMQWKGTDFLDRLLGKPKMIKEVKLFMDGKSINVVTAEELESAQKFSGEELNENPENAGHEAPQEKDESDQKSFAA